MAWSIRGGPDAGPWGGKDVVEWRWEIGRDGERRSFLIEVTRTAMADDRRRCRMRCKRRAPRTAVALSRPCLAATIRPDESPFPHTAGTKSRTAEVKRCDRGRGRGEHDSRTPSPVGPGEHDRRAPGIGGTRRRLESVFRTGDRVRLTKPFEGLNAGTEGRVLGSYARDPMTYVIEFSGGTVKEVPPELLEAVGELPMPNWALSS